MRKSFVFAALIASAAASTALASDANFSGFKAEKVTELGLSAQNSEITGLTAEAGVTGVKTQSFAGGELFGTAKGGTLADDATVAKFSGNKADLFTPAKAASEQYKLLGN